MKINFSKLNYTFTKKPLVIGGMAMEYYGLRKSGDDIDFIVCKQDIEALVQKHPQYLKDIWGDFGIAIYEFEIWKTINYLSYDELIKGAIEEENYYVISLDNLLSQKAMAAMDKPEKYMKDLKLVVKKIQSIQAKKYESIKNDNKRIVDSLKNVNYVEKIGPNK